MYRGNQPEPIVVAIVPVYNEERGVKDTINSLFNQTTPPRLVIIVANNCKDNTANAARELIPTYGQEHLQVLEFPKLEGKKAGALNRGYFYVRDNSNLKPEFILQMDGDTVLEEHLIEQAVIEFDRDDYMIRKGGKKHERRLGGICSRCIPLPLESCMPAHPVTGVRKKPSLQNKILWKFQNLEYGQADPYRLKTLGNVKVLAGAVSVYRYDALEQVLEYNRSLGLNEVWSETSLVEDLKLTITTKKLGWKASVGWRMKSETDIPLTFKDFFNQRKRWYGGTALEAREIGIFRKFARDEFLAVLMAVVIWALLGVMTWLIAKVYLAGGSVDWITPWLALLPVMWSILQFQLLFVRRKDVWQILITTTILPYQLFDIYKQYILLYSWYQCYRGKLSSW